MNWLATNIIGAFLLPPFNLLLLGLCGWLLLSRRPRLGKTLIGLSGLLLYALSTPLVANSLLHSLESGETPPPIRAEEAQAIVVLGAGRSLNAPEYGGETTSAYSLQRLRYGALLQRKTGLPLLLSGGKPDGGIEPEAALMSKALVDEWHVPVRWIETASTDTWENAFFSRGLLQRAGIQRIYLVTHAWHMPRARQAFQAAGFDVVAAPTGFTAGARIRPLDFLPNANSLQKSAIFMHETIGLIWYRWRLRHLDPNRPPISTKETA
ncbi:MAG: YdcF family protein [Burkholderiales bacterium]|nr:YdcF family protein [Sulfuricellaceae bacterium]